MATDNKNQPPRNQQPQQGQKKPDVDQAKKQTTPAADDDDDWSQIEAKELALAKLNEEEKAKAKASAEPGIFEKAKDAIKHALHLDEPGHLSHATPPLDPKKAEEIKEAHKVDLGKDGAELKGLPINKVPGKLRKFMSDK